MPLNKVNHAERLYIIAESGGYSCLGFDVMDRRAKRLATELGMVWDDTIPHGEVKYNRYHELQAHAHKRFVETGIRCVCELHPDLAQYRGDRVEVTLADGTTERFTVGRSTGWIPCFLRLHSRSSDGGEAVDRDEKFIHVRKI
jgi:hypothetical protein